MPQKSLKSFFSSTNQEDKNMVTECKRKLTMADNSPKSKIKAVSTEIKSTALVKERLNLNEYLNDFDPTDFDPSSEDYDPVKDVFWTSETRTPYIALSRTFELIEAISSRLKITSTLANLLASVISHSSEDLLPCVYLSLNRLSPQYEPAKLGLGDFLIIKAISLATGKKIAHIKTMLASLGDLGNVAETCRTKNTLFKPKPLTVARVYDTLKEISGLTGKNAMGAKCDRIQALLVACRHGSETKYLVRSLGGKLRIGLAEQTILPALTQAFLKFKLKRQNSAVDYVGYLNLLKSAYCQCPNFERIIGILLTEDFQDLEHVVIQPGIPAKPMLAQPSRSIGAALATFGDHSFTCEFKYDGERAQIHRMGGKVQIFSRNLDPTCERFPEIGAYVDAAVMPGVDSFILDTETVAWDLKAGKTLPFQQLSTRKRKDVHVEDVTVTVCLFVFDILFINGTSLLKSPLRKRREILFESFSPVAGKFCFAEYSDSFEEDQIDGFLSRALKSGCEGLMLKTLDVDATYELSKRSHKWLKLKKDYLEGMGDTLDLVVIGAYHGTGKRTGYYGGFLLACYNPEDDQYETICKIGTGFSDEDLKSHTDTLQDCKIVRPKPYYAFDSAPHLQPDVWFEPGIVWEVKAADLSVSPCYKAALGCIEGGRGISLRFPRFVRIREDKQAEDATTSEQVVGMYRNQQNVFNKVPVLDGADDFY